jgi:SAM-dependent methyltransferase
MASLQYGVNEHHIGSDGLAHSLDLLKDTYNYNHWIYSLIRPYIGNSVLEVGSGCGNISRFLLDRENLTCVEPLSEHAGVLNGLAKTHCNIRVVSSLLEELPNEDIPAGSYDSVVCINVLEHIKDDAQALRNLLEALRPGGMLLLYVPALGWAYGELDREMKHFRRYSAHRLKMLLKHAGFRIEHHRYVNFIGALGWWWSGRVLKEKVIDPRKARFVDRLAPHLMAWENLVRPLIGQSLFFVAKRPSGGSS